jgi:hypothetical protein
MARRSKGPQQRAFTTNGQQAWGMAARNRRWHHPSITRSNVMQRHPIITRSNVMQQLQSTTLHPTAPHGPAAIVPELANDDDAGASSGTATAERG